MSPNLLTLTFFFVSVTKGGSGLRLTELVVPEKARLGSAQVLSCGFVLERAKLYSVKWYKDEAEFYRFMPGSRPQTRVFPVSGISLDESVSDMHRVALMRVGTNTSGVYRCEVSTEGPNFDTVMSNANLSVYSFPDRDPEITITKSYYSTREYILANCTSGFSYPAPDITWVVNNIKMGKGKEEGEEKVGEVWRRWSSLQVQEVGEDGLVTLGCVASVPHDRPRRASLRLTLDQPLTNLRLQQNPPLPSSQDKVGLRSKTISVLMGLFLWLRPLYL